jgi:hypothetical protein
MCGSARQGANVGCPDHVMSWVRKASISAGAMRACVRLYGKVTPIVGTSAECFNAMALDEDCYPGGARSE